MRGTRHIILHGALDLGITPAFAGKASGTTFKITGDGDHPRVRGEGQHSDGRNSPSLGSPPRSRGRQQLVGTDREHRGITPAFAGKARQEES